MPIKLITGLPGNGKTAHFMDTLFDMELAGSKRKIYICGIKLIKEFNLDIEVIDYQQARQWNTMSEGALFVIDEAQHFAPTRSASKEVPAFIKDLSEHRHKGFDFVLLTQDPRNLDVYSRRLINEHRHIKRLFGSLWQAVFTWDKVRENPWDKKTHVDAIKKLSRIKKRVFGSYKSAQQHTIKRRVPVALIAGVVFIVAFPLIAYFMFDTAIPDPVGSEMKVDGSQNKQANLTSSSLPTKGSLPTNRAVDSLLQQRAQLNKDNPLFIDQDLVFLDGIRYGKILKITVALVHPDGNETILTLDDLRAEEGLKYSLLTNNKLQLMQNGRKRTFYRVVRQDNSRQTDDVQEIQPLNEQLKNPFL